MTCPACGGELVEGGVRCPVCDAAVAPRVEGALAADPRLVTPPPRREPRETRDAWREEVRDRIRSRRQKRADAGLPLFDRDEPSLPSQPAAASPVAPRPVSPPRQPADAGEVRLQPPAPEPPAPETPAPPPRVPDAVAGDLVSPGLSEAELADLPLRAMATSAPRREDEAPPAVDAALAAASRPAPRRRPSPSRVPPVLPSFDDEKLLPDADREPEIALEPGTLAGPSPVERPARALTGLLGVLTVGAGLLPILFDPARRALHDRLFRTRVVRH